MIDLWPAELAGSQAVTLPARTVLASEGQRVSTIYLIEAGVVALTRRREGDDVLVGYRARGHAAGACYAVHGTTHGTTITAVGPIEAQLVPVGFFHELRRQNLRVSEWLQRILAAEVSKHTYWHAGLSVPSGEDRLLAVFVELFELASERREDGSRRLLVADTVEHLATGIGVTRERAGCWQTL